MSGLSRYVHVLRLFDERHGVWTIPDMAAAMSLPASTVYRTIREMVASGLLEATTEARYRLGCCFIEFDRIVRMTDPLYEAGASVLREMVLQARVPCAAVLARLYNDTVMCVADAATTGATLYTSYERGRPRPLTRGATSKVILAQLAPRKLSRLLASMPGDGPAYTVQPREELRDELAIIRKRGFSITRGEVDKNRVGIAAPVSLPARGLLGSLSLITEAIGENAVERRLAMLVVSTASLLTEQLATIPDEPTLAHTGRVAQRQTPS